MPGIVDPHPCSVGLYRKVGKMAYPNQDLVLDNIAVCFEDTEDSVLEEYAQFLTSDKTFDSLSSDSAPSSSSSSPSRDNVESEGELPDSENAYDLDKYWDTHGFSGMGLLSDHFDVDRNGEDNSMKELNSNPFMGLVDNSADTLLGQGCNMLEDQHSHPQVQNSGEGFVAWGHTPSEEDEHLLMLISSSMCEDTDENIPDTPSSYSGTVTGDDSDVDIETITDLPRTADSCGYATQDSSPALSPATSPSPLQNQNNNGISGLHRSISSPLFSSSSYSNSSKSIIRFNSCGVSSSASLAENLMCGRVNSAQKRKLQKERKSTSKSSASYYSQPSYQTTGSSVNFHDYAMSPSSCTSLETAQPTVVTSNKRLCKRRQLNTLDLSEKEKQHHHNQLERNRRQKLADLFIDLRDVVPNIAHQTKASKVMILNQATLYIEDIQKHEGSQVQQISKERERNQFLKRQKRQLELQLSSVK